jgi:hypothetical protein
MDGSGSINPTEFTLQADAYVSALNTVFGANPSLYGDIAIQGTIFGSTVAEYFAARTIEDASDLMDLTDAIIGLKADRIINTGATAIGDGIAFASNALTVFETATGVDMSLLIDVTTDGQHNSGQTPGTASTAAYAAGIDAVNCLGVGSGATCDWVVAPGVNFGVANDFASFEAALTEKLRAETGTNVPLPGTLMLLGLGLLGFRMVERKV